MSWTVYLHVWGTNCIYWVSKGSNLWASSGKSSQRKIESISKMFICKNLWKHDSFSFEFCSNFFSTKMQTILTIHHTKGVEWWPLRHPKVMMTSNVIWCFCAFIYLFISQYLATASLNRAIFDNKLIGIRFSVCIACF